MATMLQQSETMSQQCCNAVLRLKSSLRIVPCNIAFTKGINSPGGTLLREVIGNVPLDGSHFHDWSDYNGVAFSIELLDRDRNFSDFGGK